MKVSCPFRWMWRQAAGEIALIRARAFAFGLASHFVSRRERRAEL